MSKLGMQADKYFNNKSSIDSSWGGSVLPVDLNGAYVPVKTNKWGMAPEGATCAQDNIQSRFGLEEPDCDCDGGGE